MALLDGRSVFVPYTAPGDRVVAEVPSGEGAAHGALVEVLSAGASRVDPPCPHFGQAPAARCGGCEWLHVAYAAQLGAKERAFQESLRRIGRLEEGQYTSLPILGAPSPLRYRARAKFHLDRGSGRLAFFRRRSHDPVPLRTCHLLLPELDLLREEAGPALVAARLEARAVTLEWSRRQGRGAAHLQLASLGRAMRERAGAFLAAVPQLSGLVLSADGSPTVVVGEPVLRQARVPQRDGGSVQRSRPDVFLQSNREANALLVERALSLLAPEGEEVLELFCGAGNFTAPLAARARSVVAVEAQGPALELARADAAEGRGQVRFVAGDALAVAHGLARDRASPPGFASALLDPPREGARGAAAALHALGVRRFVYVSCDPATLARDLRAAVEAGFRVEVAQAIDLFPQTHHVEGVALLTR